MFSAPEIAGYRIEKELGQGGMATVYLGVQENLNREVAIKVLTPEMFQDQQYLRRFLNEAHTASRLSHPNIVTIHDVGQVDNHCYIVMERLHQSLVEYVKFKPGGKLSPREAFKIIRKMAAALDYAHNEGVIHRDIKPDNILFRKDGTPVLVDFGIARAMDSQAQLTTTGMLIGTPHYMSPEQCRGEHIDGQSDLYSLGIVLYEILTGDVPYRADSAAGVLLKHVQYPIPQLPPELSKYQPVITRLMAKTKRERIQNGAELIHLLDSMAPDMRIDTIQGIQEDAWVFDDSPRRGTRSKISADEDAGIMTLHSPLQSPMPPPGQKSRGPLLVVLISVPIILAAAYFLFFRDMFSFIGGTTSTAAVEETGTPPPVTAGKKDESGTEQKAEQKDNQTDNQTGGTDEQYRQQVGLAEKYIEEKDYEKALATVAKARAIKDTPELKALEESISQQYDAANEQEFLKYYTLARNAYKSGKYEKARENLREAGKYKSGSRDLETLEQDIAAAEKKKAERDEKARQAAALRQRLQQQDDNAFNKAKSANTMHAFEKYLKNYPKGRHAEEAQKKFDELKHVLVLEDKIKDDTCYGEAVKAGTIPAYEDYLDKYPFGQHVREAQTGINRLKEKILKEIQTPVELRRVRFFESGKEMPDLERRTYAARFSRESTRYIYTEIDYDNKLYRIARKTCRVTIHYSVFDQDLAGTIELDSGARNGIYSRGMGYSEAGKWPVGSYSVTVYLDGRKIGQAQFVVE